jgi:uncharacterized protein (DUF1499 family)
MDGLETHLRGAERLMAKRRLIVEPTSRLAIWSRRLAVFSLVATVLSIIVVRSGMVEIVPALATFAGALSLAVLAILFAFGAFVVIWRNGNGGLGRAVAAVAIGAVLLAYPAYLGFKAYRLPAIYDVTTDPIDPPRFEALARLRPREGTNNVIYAGLYAAEQQRMAYPEIEPLRVTGTPQQAFKAATTVMEKRKWAVIAAIEPLTGRREGRIEAVARTPIMGFRDDVVVRIRLDPDGAVIDARSASRYGRHDLGTNAARVRSLLEDIDEAVDALLPDKTEKKPPPTTRAQAPAKGAPVRR